VFSALSPIKGANEYSITESFIMHTLGGEMPSHVNDTASGIPLLA
jgi:hypothetical protein